MRFREQDVASIAMRAYPANKLNFLETVQIYFLEVTGKGVVLGSRDAELLQAWRAEGATAAAICQGIDDAVRARTELPRSIAGCRKWVEPRIEASRSLRTGRHESTADADETSVPAAPRRASDWADEALARIVTAGEAAERTQVKDAYRGAYRKLRSAIEKGEDLAQVLLEIEVELSEEVFEALHDEEQAGFERSLDRDRLDSMGSQARERFVEAARRRYLEESFGLISVFE